MSSQKNQNSKKAANLDSQSACTVVNTFYRMGEAYMNRTETITTHRNQQEQDDMPALENPRSVNILAYSHFSL